MFLIFGTVGAFFLGGIQTLAYVKVMKDVWGWAGYVLVLFIWPFSLLIPGFLWWAAIKETPSIYASEATTVSRAAGVRKAVITVILLVVFSIFIQWGHGRIIGWMAS